MDYHLIQEVSSKRHSIFTRQGCGSEFESKKSEKNFGFDSEVELKFLKKFEKIRIQ